MHHPGSILLIQPFFPSPFPLWATRCGGVGISRREKSLNHPSSLSLSLSLERWGERKRQRRNPCVCPVLTIPFLSFHAAPKPAAISQIRIQEKGLPLSPWKPKVVRTFHSYFMAGPPQNLRSPFPWPSPATFLPPTKPYSHTATLHAAAGFAGRIEEGV